MGMFFWAVTLSFQSVREETGISSIEDIFITKFQSEKLSILSGEIQCSETQVFYKKNYYSIYHSPESTNTTTCKKTFFGIHSSTAPDDPLGFYLAINPTLNTDDIEIIDNNQRIRPHEIKTIHGNPYLRFSPETEQSYQIIGEKNKRKESIQIIFYNPDFEKYAATDIGLIETQKIQGTSFRKKEISAGEVSFTIQSPLPLATISLQNPKEKNQFYNYLKRNRVSNAIITLSDSFEKTKNLEIYSANLLPENKQNDKQLDIPQNKKQTITIDFSNILKKFWISIKK